VPNLAIEGGENNSQPIRERGWTHWHHLYTPRQLLYHGLIGAQIAAISDAVLQTALSVVGMNTLLDYNSKLCGWVSSLLKSGGNGAINHTFANQALNTNYNYPSRGAKLLSDIFVRYQPIAFAHITTDTQVRNGDARTIPFDADIWITDPPYADAVNYEEITEYFVAWAQPVLQAQGWARDTQRAHAVKGNDDGFRRAMVECYQRLAQQMPANGLQVVMFTHK
ncbi:MAG: DNA methylase, partial [Roseiflexaceae bacterium]